MTRFLAALTLLSALPVAAHDADEDSWVVVRDDKSATMHGDIGDLKIARRHLREFGPGYLWFRHDGKEYVVRDGAVIKAIDEMTRPQEDLGQAQSELGRRQSDLGHQQAKLGEQQARLGQRQAEVSLREAHRGLRGERTDKRDRDEQREIDDLQRELSKAQETLGREQEKIGHEQEKMGREQEKLSKKVQRKVEELIEASLKNGAAKRVD